MKSDGDETGSPKTGADTVRTALGRAKAIAEAAGARPKSLKSKRSPLGGKSKRRFADPGGFSGPGPDRRDPQPLGLGITGLVRERGWTTPVAVGGVMGRWDQVVGEDIAAHCAPETHEGTVLTVRAASTAWATQLRLLAPQLLQRIEAVLGRGVVTRLVVKGPAGPTWKKGLRSVSGGRGPRDTYG